MVDYLKKYVPSFLANGYPDKPEFVDMAIHILILMRSLNSVWKRRTITVSESYHLK